MLLTTLQLSVNRPHLGRIEVAARVGKPDIAAIHAVAPVGGAEGTLQDCLSSGLCLNECIDKAGGKICGSYLITGELGPEEDCCPQAVYDIDPLYCDYLGAPRKRCENPEGGDWWHEMLPNGCKEFVPFFNLPGHKFISRAGLCNGEYHHPRGPRFTYCDEEALRCLDRAYDYCEDKWWWLQFMEDRCKEKAAGCCGNPRHLTLGALQGNCNAHLWIICSGGEE